MNEHTRFLQQDYLPLKNEVKADLEVLSMQGKEYRTKIDRLESRIKELEEARQEQRKLNASFIDNISEITEPKSLLDKWLGR